LLFVIVSVGFKFSEISKVIVGGWGWLNWLGGGGGFGGGYIKIVWRLASDRSEVK
jgi:hypothetical protein